MILYRFTILEGGILPKLIISLSIDNLLWFIYYQNKDLKHNNCFEQKLNMNYFIQATEHDVHMYAKFEYFNFYEIL
jgi:hypothetical protein